MSMRILGPTLDIHGGGLDLQFPHHENELAQSESYTGVTFVRYWMHNGLMKTGHLKMSKSVGNEIVVSDLLKRHQPETLRFFLLSTHYRRPIDYSEERLVEVRRGLDAFYRFFERFQRIANTSFYDLKFPTKRSASEHETPVPEGFGKEIQTHRTAFLECMDDDFNTGGAIGILFELLNSLNRFADAGQLESGKADPGVLGDFQGGAVVLGELSHVLGIFREPPPRMDKDSPQLVDRLVTLFRELTDTQDSDLEQAIAANGGKPEMDRLMKALIDLRARSRKAKNFALADQIRQRLVQMGITLEDRPGGTDWRAE
jgi:cysteinyl-tRNA synthetase